MKKLDSALFDTLRQAADISTRGRAHHTLHPDPSDPTQRMCVAINPGSYVQPHRHANPAKWELFIVIEGSASILIFDDDAVVSERIELDSTGHVRAFEIPQESWHTLVAKSKGTILVEIKPGPYEPLTNKDFAAWAPKEGDTAALEFEKLFHTAQIGDYLSLSK